MTSSLVGSEMCIRDRVESGFPFARIAPDGGRIFGIGPDRCSGHAGPDTCLLYTSDAADELD
eukprot:10785845-Prorocentrum_lima.AAC.1